MLYSAPIVVSLLSLATALPSPHKPNTKTPNDTGSCSARSMGDFAWTIENFQYRGSYIFSTPSHQVPSGSASFVLSNPAVDFKGTCNAASTQLTDFFYGTVAYDCVFDPASGTSAQFLFDRPSGLLHVSQSWNCADLGPNSRFDAKGNVTLGLTCSEENWVNDHYQPNGAELYSTRTVTCKSADVAAPPYEMTAVA